MGSGAVPHAAIVPMGKDRLEAVLDSGEETNIPLASPLPVYIVYLTAWVAEDGALHFRPDLYSRDAKLAGLLQARRQTD